MNKEQGRNILRVIDTPFAVETISAYADNEIEKANKGLATLTDPIQIYRLQGIVQAMNTLKTIRDEAVSATK